MKDLRLQIKERFNFFLERQFIKGTHVQLLFVVLLIGLLSIAGGLMVMPLEDSSDSMGETLWWAFLRLTDPGYLGDDEGMWRRMVSTFLTIAGNVVFIGSLVAIITTWLNRKIRNLEQGFSKVSARNHILILGWNNRTTHIAGELFQSSKRVKRFLKRRGAKNLKLIILSDDVNSSRLQELKDHPSIGKHAKEIILRSGVSIDREDLQRVASQHASAIIIPSQSTVPKEYITPDVETIKTLLSLNSEMQSLENTVTKPIVVAEIQDENKLKAAYRAYKGPLEVVASDTIVSRLIAQNLHHKGLSAVYNELLSHSIDNNMYVLELPQAAGKTIHDLKALFHHAILLGVVREHDNRLCPYLNPRRDMVFNKNDKLILLARKLEDIEITYDTSKLKASEDIPAEIKDRPPTGNYIGVSNLLILGWNHHVPALIKELSTYKNQEFHVTLASLRPFESRQIAIGHILRESENLVIQDKLVDYIREPELQSLNPDTFDHILLLSSDKLVDDEEADARTIVGYTLLEEMLESAINRPQIVMELTDPGNEMLLKSFNSESIISPLILSNLLATIAIRRELFSVYNELFTVDGAEIIFRSLDEYNIEPSLMTFQELSDHIIKYQDTALGLICNSEGDKNELHLNPPKQKNFSLKSKDQIVVLSTITSKSGSI